MQPAPVARKVLRGCCNAVSKARRAAASVHTSTANRKEKHVVYSDFPSVELPNESVPGLIFRRAKKWAHLDAIECGMTGRKYTYGGMIDRALRWGAVVNKVLPPEAGRRNIAMLCKNGPEFPIIVLGTQAVGALVTTVSHNFTVEEVARQIKDADVNMMVVDAALEGLLRAALTKLGLSIPIFVNGQSEFRSPNLREILEDTGRPFAELVEIDPESIAMMLYSSGTTGKPKGVALSHRAFTNNMEMFTQPSVFAYKPTTAEYQETTTGILPFYHIYGTHVVNMFNMYLGAKTVSLPAFTPNDFVRIIIDHKVEVVHLVPPMLNFLIHSPAVTPKVLASMRTAMCAAAPVPPSSAIALKEKAPNPILFQEGFGMSEALGTHMTPVAEEKIGYCGKLVPNTEGKIVDVDTGEALPEGEKGELCMRSPSLMSYYYNNPVATEETVDSEGWLHTGDIAIQENGFFSIVDRMKELIKVKGIQVSPSELEEELLKHPAIKDVGIVPVEDERSGELPRAYIIKNGDVSAEDIMNYMKDKVAAYKQLHGGIRFVEELPKNPTGKLLRRELKALAAKDP